MRKLKPTERKRLQALQTERDQITFEILSLQARIAELQRRGQDIALQIADLTTPLKTRRGLPTGKNANLHCAWETFKVMTWNGSALSAHDFYEGLRQEIHNLKPVTFRSYLHRLKKQGLIEKRGLRWHRMPAAVLTAAEGRSQ